LVFLRTTQVLGVWCISALCLASSSVQSKGQTGVWEKISEKEHLTIYRKEVKGSRILAFRGEGFLDATPTQVLSVLMDNARSPEWVASLKEARVIRHITEFKYIEYNLVSTPPLIMKHRDFVSLVTLEVDVDKLRLTLRFKSHVDLEVPEIKKYVRGSLNNSVFIMTGLEDGSRTFFEAEIHADPKGRVPRWLVNWFQKGWPKWTFKGLRKQLKKPDVFEDPKIRALLPQSQSKNEDQSALP